jgi:putative ABC transport system permease protein
MARQNSARNPKRTSRTASPVLIGVALVVAVTALAASIKGQIDDVFTAQFKGDYAISTDARGFGGISPSLAVDLNKLPQVEKATGFGFLTVKINDKLASCKVSVTRSDNSVVTVVLLRIDSPKSPWMTLPSQCKYWLMNGSLR